MKKKGLGKLLRIALLTAIVTALACVSAAAYSASDIEGSWYGQYTGSYDPTSGPSVDVERYIDLTIDSCDNSGAFSGSAKVTTVEGQGYDSQWFNYDFEGTVNLNTGAFYFKGNRITGGSTSTTWSTIPFDGTLRIGSTGDLTISGYVDNNTSRLFRLNRISGWVRDEITEANIAGLIPDTLQEADLSKRITRAEFAAVSVKLYEALSGTTASAGSTPFTDIASDPNKTDIAKAYRLGIAVGVSATEFDPDVSINREQLVTMLTRAVKKYAFSGWTIDTDDEYYLDTSGVPKFADDAYISDFAKPSVYYMTKMKIIAGVDSTHFAPQNITPEQEAQGYATATREQAIALSLRIFKLGDAWK